MKFTQIAAASLLASVAIADPAAKRGLNIIDDIGNGLNHIMNPVDNLAGDAVCDTIKAMGIHIPGLTENIPDQSMFHGLIKYENGMATTGTISLSDCSIKDGKAILGMAATAELNGGEISAINNKYDLPDAKVPYSISIAADVCRHFGIPTGIKNFHIDSIKVGDATVDEHKIPKEILQFANTSLEKYATKAINNVSIQAILKDNQNGAC